jgi:hypothetical protein
LAESWDPVGECAWMQHDINDIAGFKGHWYAICEADGDEWYAASYEVAAVEKERS